MANVTDPLAKTIHGTNPQNLLEYITRQKIYDSQYWKEHCFGLTAANVAEKAALQLKAIGGSYGGNSKPTRFLCLILKLLQIQPDDTIVEELIANEDFKYVRALGALYLRLTGTPADIYEKLEPIYNDYRCLRCRNHSDWTLLHVDEFIDCLLVEDRFCGIALPRLPKRQVLVDAGYLVGPRHSGMSCVIPNSKDFDEKTGNDKDMEGLANVEQFLANMARCGNEAAIEALKSRPRMKIRNDSNFRKEDSNLKANDKKMSPKLHTDKDCSDPSINENKINTRLRSDNEQTLDDKEGKISFGKVGSQEASSIPPSRLSETNNVKRDRNNDQSQNSKMDSSDISGNNNRKKKKKYGSLFKS
mmetsp:Transcript_7050/g.10100  ORF Transcript_7050/g.10100 Transcript_7050/m.10100 type:complete len:359 (+) Transcript_7050:26-1102(+)